VTSSVSAERLGDDFDSGGRGTVAGGPTSPGEQRAIAGRLSLGVGRALLPPFGLVVLVLAAWWLAADLADSTVFPGPLPSARSLVHELGVGEFRSAALSTVALLAVSYAAVVFVGAVTGLLVGLSGFWRDAVLPLVYVFNSVPKVVLYPLFLIFLGIGDRGVGSFAFLSGVIPMFLMVVEGVASIPRVHLKLAAALQLPTWQVLRRVVLPGTLPAVIAGARVAFGLTFLGLLLGQLLAGTSGLGYELVRSVTLVRLQDIMGQALFVVLLALVPALALRVAEHRIDRRFQS
jgi:NitT/TauT family transport system permease protein